MRLKPNCSRSTNRPRTRARRCRSTFSTPGEKTAATGYSFAVSSARYGGASRTSFTRTRTSANTGGGSRPYSPAPSKSFIPSIILAISAEHRVERARIGYSTALPRASSRSFENRAPRSSSARVFRSRSSCLSPTALTLPQPHRRSGAGATSDWESGPISSRS